LINKPDTTSESISFPDWVMWIAESKVWARGDYEIG